MVFLYVIVFILTLSFQMESNGLVGFHLTIDVITLL
jgi:hypothetical protein